MFDIMKVFLGLLPSRRDSKPLRGPQTAGVHQARVLHQQFALRGRPNQNRRPGHGAVLKLTRGRGGQWAEVRVETFQSEWAMSV